MILDLRVIVHLNVVVDLKVILELCKVVIEVVSNIEHDSHAIDNNNDDRVVDVVDRHNAIDVVPFSTLKSNSK